MVGYLITSPTHANEMATLRGHLMGWVARTRLCIHLLRRKRIGQDQFLRQNISRALLAVQAGIVWSFDFGLTEP